MESGSLVMLKSGGPIMTVRYIDNNEITCEWFNHKKDSGYESTPNSYTFNSDSLEIYVPKQEEYFE